VYSGLNDAVLTIIHQTRDSGKSRQQLSNRGGCYHVCSVALAIRDDQSTGPIAGDCDLQENSRCEHHALALCFGHLCTYLEENEKKRVTNKNIGRPRKLENFSEVQCKHITLSLRLRSQRDRMR
jgi:hypothetical protein